MGSTRTELWNPAEAAPKAEPSVAPSSVPAADTDTIVLEEERPRPAVSVRARPLSMRPGELLPGTRYRLVRWLGDGGMGTVFEAVHVDLERSVALKVLRDAFSGSVLQLFRQEARTLGKLGSRFVVDVYDFLELSDGRLAIAMELLQGQTLRSVLRSGGPLSVDRVIPIARQVCKGLAAAHRAGVVHRDIKPENISLEVVEGRADAVKLLDFGIAQVGGKQGGAESRAGTPGYLAPELISGLGGDERSDLYALGCTLFELVTGRRPFDSSHASDVLLAHLGEDPLPPSTFAEIPASFEQALLRCLEKAPRDRFENAAALEVALCEVQIEAGFTSAWDDLPFPDVGQDVVDGLRRRMPTPQRAKGRPWLPWAVGGVLAVSGVAAWAGYSLRPTEASQSEDQETVQLVTEARAAAARAFYVYPPPEDPGLRTAYGCVVALEGRAEPSAGDAAAQLRTEFADTLERLGDEYWDAEGGKPFALDYYAEALVFDPGRDRARARAAMTPGELRLLRSKAQEGSFSAQELSEVEPLIVLADVPDDEKRERIAAILERSPQTRARGSMLRALGQVPQDAPPRPEPESEPEPEVEPTPDITPVDVGGGTPVVGQGDGQPEPDRAKARSLSKSADAAHAAGKTARAEALYADALAADRNHAAAHRGLGRVAYDRGNYALAARRLKKAVRLAPRRAEYRIAFGDALFKSFDYAGAKAQYMRAKDLGASQADARLAKVAKKLR